MTTGCKECDEIQAEKGDGTSVCDMCELEMLQCTAQSAVEDYIDKVNEILKEKQKCQM